MPHTSSWPRHVRRSLSRLARALTPRLVHPPERTAASVDITPPPQPPEPAPVTPTQEDAARDLQHTPVSMARGLGLKLSTQSKEVERTGHTLTLPGSLDVHDVPSRATLTATLIAARHALDQEQVAWTPEIERPVMTDKAYQKKDIPSSYGERMPRLIPKYTREVLVERLEEELLFEPFDQHFDIIFVLEVGKHLHVMTHEAAQAAALTPERISQDARYTLFYQSYKIKPERQTHTWGKSRYYLTREGLGATRALMLPDFDIQAAREQGFAAIISRDELLTVEPHTPEDRDAARAWCQQRADALRAQARYPYISPLITLSLS